MIAALRDLVWIEKAMAIRYLGPLLNLLHHQKRLVIASLNYDNGIELLANSQGVPCITGIERWSTSGSFEFDSEGFFIIKLHGSIDWTWERNTQTLERPMPHSVIRQVNPDKAKELQLRPAVIFGQRNKLTAEGPFLDLLRAFRQELSQASKLTVVGYSFRDPHINVFISQWLNAGRDRVIRIVNGPNSENQPVEYIQALLNLRNQIPQQVDFIPEYAGAGLRTLYGSYDGSFEEAVVAKADSLPEEPTRFEASDIPPSDAASPISKDTDADS